MWQEPRMILNASADWSTGEINVRGDMINNFWTPDIIIHDLVNFNKPEILNQVAALEIKDDRRLYYKVRYVKSIMENLNVLIGYVFIFFDHSKIQLELNRTNMVKVNRCNYFA